MSALCPAPRPSVLPPSVLPPPCVPPASVPNVSAVPSPVARPVARADADGGPRDLSIETLRGLAVLLMVLCHVIGDSGERGLRVEEDSLYRYGYFSCMYLRMPLFTVIAGFVYAARPVSFGTAGRFLKGKSRRLLVPFATVAALQFAVQHVMAGLTPGVNHAGSWSDLWRVYAFSFDQFWFLQALFAVFLVVIALDGAGLMTTFGGWAACLAAGAAAAHFLPKPEVFSLWGALYLLPYFLLGCGVRRFEPQLSTRTVAVAFGIAFAALFALQQFVWFAGLGADVSTTGWLGLSVGLTGTTLLLRHRRSFAPLAFLGASSFAIYLFHVFGAAGSRIALTRLGVTDRPSLLTLGLAAGLGLPIVLELGLKRSRFLRATLLGLK